MIVSAPSKIVLWGEYAVLAGAPAAVMALDRRCTVELDACPHWRFSTAGLMSPGIHQFDPHFSSAQSLSLTVAILSHWGYEAYPCGMRCHIDTTALYSSGTKLGLGSSAAVGVALYTALARILGRPAEYAEASAIHKAWQGNKGSGLDVAASWHGGIIRFQNQQVTPIKWPESLSSAVVWTGAAASSPDQIGQFNDWRESGSSEALAELVQSSEHLFDKLPTDNEKTSPFLAALADYTRILQSLDQAAKLNIFSQEHQRLATIAAANGLVYKPCGAGGGDIGMALTDDPTTLAEFSQAVQRAGFTLLSSEIGKHGVQVGH